MSGSGADDGRGVAEVRVGPGADAPPTVRLELGVREALPLGAVLAVKVEDDLVDHFAVLVDDALGVRVERGDLKHLVLLSVAGLAWGLTPPPALTTAYSAWPRSVKPHLE